jgi:peptide/nickel transport system permease protein
VFQYLIRKLLMAIPLVLGVVTLIFLLLQLTPGDATDRFFTPETPPEVREMIEAKWGLDQPVHIQYGRMMANMMQGDFGRSIAQERPVFDIIMDAVPNTLMLSIVTLVVIYSTGILMGTIQAVKQYSFIDNALSVISLFFYSMPRFWLALMLVLIFALKLDLLPAAGMVDAVEHEYMSPGEQVVDRLKHLLLPGIALGVASAAGTARYMRSSMLEVIRLDYIRTARAKGLKESTVVFKHALRNALLPIVTLMGLSLPFLFSGSVLVEIIFAWPGMGRLIVGAIFSQDTPLIIACFFVFTLMVVAGNLLADVLYSIVDPRIRLG